MSEGRDKAQALDAYLVAGARGGDAKAFALLVRRWDGRLRAHAWRLLRDEEQARDAVQDGWAEIVRGLRRLQDERAFAAWAYRIVSRRCARTIGAAQARRRLEAAVAAAPAPAAPEAAPDAERLRRAIAALPPEQGAAVALFHLEDMTVAEVAVALDVPAGTVKTRLMHARRKLRAALEGE
ncbi:MAG: RNA polymerase sigma factor [Allosphingosinicella sp.]|uniref:RNA polymerase sigma factor n=1 Tax=Allosphingosinicella sp. TaxID=2823234 RepID=UPI0039513760